MCGALSMATDLAFVHRSPRTPAGRGRWGPGNQGVRPPRCAACASGSYEASIGPCPVSRRGTTGGCRRRRGPPRSANHRRPGRLRSVAPPRRRDRWAGGRGRAVHLVHGHDSSNTTGIEILNKLDKDRLNATPRLVPRVSLRLSGRRFQRRWAVRSSRRGSVISSRRSMDGQVPGPRGDGARSWRPRLARGKCASSLPLVCWSGAMGSVSQPSELPLGHVGWGPVAPGTRLPGHSAVRRASPATRRWTYGPRPAR